MIKRAMILVLLLLGTNCASPVPLPASPGTPTPASPSARVLAPTPTPTPPYTPTPTLAAPSELRFFWQAQRLLQSESRGVGDPQPLYEALAYGIIEFLTPRVPPNVSLRDHSALEALKQVLTGLNPPRQMRPSLAVVRLGAARGVSKEVVVLSFERIWGIPIVAIHRVGSSFTPLTWETFVRSGYSHLSPVEAVDVTHDGIDELVYGYLSVGGSAVHQEIHLARWQADRTAFHDIFRAYVVPWTGEPTTYEFVPVAQGYDLKLTYPWYGAFDSRGPAHRSASDLWTYDSDLDWMVLAQRTLEPPRSARHQLNAAEDLFRDGDLEAAVREFERAATDPNLIDEPFGKVIPSSRGFARFRQGMALGLLGRNAEAQTALALAKSAGGDLARLTDAYLKNYHGQGDAICAWAMLPNEIDLAWTMYASNDASNLNLPADATELVHKGGVVAAYLNAHPSHTADPDLAFQALRECGLNWQNYRILDWDGDGQNEILFITREGIAPYWGQTVWLAYRKGERWRARQIFWRGAFKNQRFNLRLDQLVQPPNRLGSVVLLKSPWGERDEPVGIAWDGARLWWLDPETLEPIKGEKNEIVVGLGPIMIEF